MRVQQFRMVVSGTITYDETKDDGDAIMDMITTAIDTVGEVVDGCWHNCTTAIGSIETEDTGKYDPEHPEQFID